MSQKNAYMSLCQYIYQSTKLYITVFQYIPKYKGLYQSMSQSSRKCCTTVPSVRAEQGSCEPISQLKAHMREREMAHKALELLLTAQSAFERERERDRLTRLLNSCSQRVRERDQLTRLLTSCSQLTARSKERDQLTRLLKSCSQLRARSRERDRC